MDKDALYAKIEICRGDGRVLLQYHNNLRGPLQWNAFTPDAEIVEPSGFRLAGFIFQPYGISPPPLYPTRNLTTSELLDSANWMPF